MTEAAVAEKPVEIQARWGKFYVCGRGPTVEAAREHLAEIIEALDEGLPLIGAPVRVRGARGGARAGWPRRIESVLEVDDAYRVRLEGETVTRPWAGLEYWK